MARAHTHARTHKRTHIHTHIGTHMLGPKQHCSHMSTLALLEVFFFVFFFCHFSSWRYLPFNSIKTFKQPNWKQLPGKIKLHKQNYSDRLRLILGIWALLGPSNNSTGTFSAVLGLTGQATRRWVVCVCVCVSCTPQQSSVYLSSIRAGADIKPKQASSSTPPSPSILSSLPLVRLGTYGNGAR